MKEKVINLGNDQQYYVADEINYQDHIYAYAILVDNASGELYVDKSIVIEEKNIDGKIIIDKIPNPDLEKQLGAYFLQRLQNKN
jgi:hypothetical protein